MMTDQRANTGMPPQHEVGELLPGFAAAVVKTPQFR